MEITDSHLKNREPLSVQNDRVDPNLPLFLEPEGICDYEDTKGKERGEGGGRERREGESERVGGRGGGEEDRKGEGERRRGEGERER